MKESLALIIHPMWVIDENAMMDFSLDCVMPIIPPVSAFMIEIINISFNSILDIKIDIKIDKGASFWTDLRIRHDHHEMDDITVGNHIWHGTIPNFMIIDVEIRSDIIHVILDDHRILEVIRRILDPRAWIRKYLIIASDSWNFDEFVISGMNDNIFSSNPIHINNQLFAERTIIRDVGRRIYSNPLIKIFDENM